MTASEETRALVAVIRELPARQQQAIVLRHIEGMSNPEIGAAMDCSVEAVESLLARARRQLTKDVQRRREALGYD